MMTSNTEPEDIINKILLDGKKDLLKDMAEKNVEQIKKIKKQLPATIENLQTDVDSLELSALQDKIEDLKANESLILKDLKKLHNFLDFLNTVDKNKDIVKQQDLDVEHILSVTSEDQAGYNKLKSQFVKIGQLSKKVERKINEFNDE